MKRILYHFALLVSLLSFSVEARATHIVGGDITVRYLSPNSFEVTVIFFRDCNAALGFENPIYVGVYDKVTHAQQQIITMPLISTNILPLGDPCYTPPSLCVERGVFQTTVSIPDNPNGYYLSYHRCCRNGIINNIVNPGGSGYVFYCEIADPALQSSTPVFNTIPDAYMCQNLANSDNFSATDADGDVLVYSFTDPLDCAATGICGTAAGPSGTYGTPDPWAWPGPYGTITWQPPYALNNILGDPAMAVGPTGTVTCTPPSLGVFVFCVRVEEYRGGVKIGEIRRDFQFQVLACDAFNVTVPGTNPICLGETTTLQANGGPPGATYLWNTGQTTSSITAVPPSPGTYTFTVTATAGSCSITSSATVAVNPVPSASVATAGNVCLGQNTTLTASGGGTYSWNTGTTNSVLTGVGNGSYTVTVTNGFSCTDQASGTVNQAPVLTSSVVLNYTPCSGSLASATVNHSGGATAYSYAWSNSQATQTATGLNNGNYTVTVTDGNGCTSVSTQSVTLYPPVIANFNSSAVCLGNPTQFTDQSNTAATSWSWNFGDGGTSTQQSPSHTYTASGTYSVTLTSSGSGGCDSSLTKVVAVHPQPVANYAVTTVCLGLATQFTDQSTGGANQWAWNFGDGNSSTQQNPSNTYTAAGTYTSTLTSTATPGGCNSIYSQLVTVHPVAVPDFITTDICLNTNPAVFTDQSAGAVEWIWNFGDGSPYFEMQNPTHIFSAPGTYSVTLLVQSAGGCVDSIVKTINVNPIPDAIFTSNVVCFNNLTQFTDQSLGSPVQWFWNFGDSVSGTKDTSSLQNPTHQFTAPGTYTVVLVATNSLGCSDTLPLTAVVNPFPLANFIAPTVCIGNTTCFKDTTVISSGVISSWSWNFDDPTSGSSNTSSIQHPCHVFTAVGTYNVILTAISNNNCQSSVILPISVTVPPVASFSVNTVCLNSPTNFTDLSTGAVQWSWNFGDGGTSALQNPSHVYLGFGTYVVTLVASAGGICTDTITDTIYVSPLPIIAMMSDSVCVGESTSFTDASFIPAGSITNWNWDFGDPVSGTDNTSSLQNPTHIYSSAGTYIVTLTATSAAGCQNSKTFSVVVFPGPTAEFSFTPASPINLGDLVTFSDQSAGTPVQWWWDFGDGDTSVLQNPEHSFPDISSYTVTLIVTTQNGCTDTVKYPVEILHFAFYIPNAFTPGVDGINDYFFGKGVGIVEYEMDIFDRWGNHIFYCRINDLPQTPPCMWDGKVEAGTSNERVQEDIYIWKVKLLDIFGETHKYIGTVTVVR